MAVLRTRDELIRAPGKRRTRARPRAGSGFAMQTYISPGRARFFTANGGIKDDSLRETRDVDLFREGAGRFPRERGNPAASAMSGRLVKFSRAGFGIFARRSFLCNLLFEGKLLILNPNGCSNICNINLKTKFAFFI